MPRWLAPLALAVLASPALAQLPPDKALATMKPGDGLQVELFAAEPLLVNPTAIDVDPQGRVWVAEAVNYRRVNFNRPILRPEGDRIVVLTDKDGDGKADDSTVFYQGKDLYGPLSVLVLPQPDGKGTRVLVAQSPDILEFWDKDGDTKADGPPTKWLSGFGGFDHDHGVHGLTVGPDGKLYFTVGDSGVTGLQSKDGTGKKWVSNTTDCQKGTVWRIDLDGKHLELIAHNFRNNYEACVDSFGEVWLSDNDDDGNQQTRICFVLPGGNYGYGPRGPGQSHWHEEQPGIVHKTLRTGFGSPTGICFYEGNLLPSQYRGDLIHADAGPREIRYFKRTPKGAGYELEKINMLTSTDNWFRPSDVCVAPDGSVFVADWYDPGVGGHGMGDWKMGRIYRLTPTGHKGYKGYKVPAVDLTTKEGVLAALGSPCVSVRQEAVQAMRAVKADDPQHLMAVLQPRSARPAADAAESRRLARLRWQVLEAVREVLRTSKDAQAGLAVLLLVVGLDAPAAEADRTAARGQLARMYRRLFDDPASAGPRNAEAVKLLVALASDGGKEDQPLSTLPAGFRRELALFLAAVPAEHARATFYELAKLYDGNDLFYRAALNIALGTDPARRDAILADFDKHFPKWDEKTADLVWELRPKSVLPRLEKLLADANTTPAQKARVVDILAVNDDPAAGKTMLALLTADQPDAVKARALDSLRLFLPTKWNALGKATEIKAAVDALLADPKSAGTGLQLIAAAGYYPGVGPAAKLAADTGAPPAVRLEAVRTLGTIKDTKAVDALKPLLTDPAIGPAAIDAVAAQIVGRAESVASKTALGLLEGVVTGSGSLELKRAAVAALAGNRIGTGWLLQQQEAKKLPPDLVADAGRLLRNSPFQGERNKAMILFPAPGKLDPKRLPAPTELAKRKGDAESGRKIMQKSLTSEVQCLKCHTVQGQGGQIGPDLSMIGKKGSRENLFESILVPSKAIADQYLSWSVEGEDGATVTGLIVQETETTLTLRDANGKDHAFPAKGTGRKKSLVSIMPEGLAATLTEDEIVDLVEYMTTLQTPSLTPDSWQLAGPFPGDTDAALDVPTDVETQVVFDAAAKFPGKSGKPVGWQTVRPGANGYIDLAALHGKDAPRSVSYLYRVIRSPADLEATIHLGTDDGCRLWVNGVKVFGHERHEAAAPSRDKVPVKLKTGANTILLKVNNGNNPHGVYLSLTSAQELKP